MAQTVHLVPPQVVRHRLHSKVTRSSQWDLSIRGRRVELQCHIRVRGHLCIQDKDLLEIGKIDFPDLIVAIPEVQVAIHALGVLKVPAARPEHQDQEDPVLECHQGHQVVLLHNGAVVIVVLILADLMVNLHG